jgi:Spx/MgsR family transcriptional regulator
MPFKIYTYEKCGTCRKALKFLDARRIAYRAIPILERPPRKAELKRMLTIHDRDVRKLFNTSGREYNRLKLKEKLPGLTASEAIELLARNGRLVRRPFLLTGARGVVGFNEAGWKDLLK